MTQTPSSSSSTLWGVVIHCKMIVHNIAFRNKWEKDYPRLATLNCTCPHLEQLSVAKTVQRCYNSTEQTMRAKRKFGIHSLRCHKNKFIVQWNDGNAI